LASDFHPDVVVLASDWQTLITSVFRAVSPIPVIAEFHNAYDYIMRKVGVSENKLTAGIVRHFHWQTLKHLGECAKMVVLTESDARCWRRHFDNVCVIPNPVTIYPNAIDDVTKDPGRIIFVGRFNHEKRVDRLVIAFSKLAVRYPHWHVDIFGEGNEKKLIEQLISDYNLGGRVIIHNPTKTIFEEYKRSEMLVLCSEHEARPLVLVEAMACGIPCVSLDCPYGPREIITDGVTGLLARDGDVKDLAVKMEWLMTHNEERREMGLRAREEAAKYKMSVIMQEWINLYTGFHSL
jgi:glycosyltransferase involved in cell wall biosynthesis